MINDQERLSNSVSQKVNGSNTRTSLLCLLPACQVRVQHTKYEYLMNYLVRSTKKNIIAYTLVMARERKKFHHSFNYSINYAFSVWPQTPIASQSVSSHYPELPILFP